MCTDARLRAGVLRKPAFAAEADHAGWGYLRRHKLNSAKVGMFLRVVLSATSVSSFVASRRNRFRRVLRWLRDRRLLICLPGPSLHLAPQFTKFFQSDGHVCILLLPNSEVIVTRNRFHLKNRTAGVSFINGPMKRRWVDVRRTDVTPDLSLSEQLVLKTSLKSIIDRHRQVIPPSAIRSGVVFRRKLSSSKGIK
jgi:hypothetical protein